MGTFLSPATMFLLSVGTPGAFIFMFTSFLVFGCYFLLSHESLLKIRTSDFFSLSRIFQFWGFQVAFPSNVLLLFLIVFHFYVLRLPIFIMFTFDRRWCSPKYVNVHLHFLLVHFWFYFLHLNCKPSDIHSGVQCYTRI